MINTASQYAFIIVQCLSVLIHYLVCICFTFIEALLIKVGAIKPTLLEEIMKIKKSIIRSKLLLTNNALT